MAAVCVRADAEGWRRRDRRTDGRPVRREARGEPVQSSRADQVGAVPRAAGAAGVQPPGGGGGAGPGGSPPPGKRGGAGGPPFFLAELRAEDFSPLRLVFSRGGGRPQR